jgi:hypothetical protein
LGRFGCRLGVAAVDDYACALHGEQFGHRQTDTAGAADDDRTAAD